MGELQELASSVVVVGMRVSNHNRFERAARLHHGFHEFVRFCNGELRIDHDNPTLCRHEPRVHGKPLIARHEPRHVSRICGERGRQSQKSKWKAHCRLFLQYTGAGYCT